MKKFLFLAALATSSLSADWQSWLFNDETFSGLYVGASAGIATNMASVDVSSVLSMGHLLGTLPSAIKEDAKGGKCSLSVSCLLAGDIACANGTSAQSSPLVTHHLM